MVKAEKKKLRINEVRIRILRKRLRETNDQAIKYAVGELSEEEYAPIRLQRTAWEEQIFELKKKILEEEEAEKNAENNNNASKDGDN
jgi:hypothetical protein